MILLLCLIAKMFQKLAKIVKIVFKLKKIGTILIFNVDIPYRI